MNDTLTPEQIVNWRKMIAIQIEERAKKMGLPDGDYGVYAFIMPEEEVISYWRKMKVILEKPEQKEDTTAPKKIYKKKCDHTNSIKGSKGRYCLDCEMYV